MGALTNPGEGKDVSGKPARIKLIFGLILGFLLINGSFYIIGPNERGNVRRLGVPMLDKNSKPIQPGFHFKIPFADQVDKVQVSLTTLHIPPFAVNTIDNQKITIDINFNFTIPENRVYHLLYEVGGAGNVDIGDSVIPVAKDRAARIFARQNTTMVSQNREQIQAEVEGSITRSVNELFGIEAHSLQIAGITYSDAFIASNEAAVRAKNEAVAAENSKRTIQFKADQKVIEAKGQADSAIEAARGRSQATVLEAEANKTRAELEGLGTAARLRAEIEALGGPRNYLDYLRYKAALNWNGQQPQVMVAGGTGAGGGGQAIVIPVPMTAFTGAGAGTAPAPAETPAR